MNINISFSEIGSLVADFTRVGYNAAVADYDPPQDKLKKSEVKKWLKFRHIEYKTFTLLEKYGYIHARHTSAAINSPMVYSKTEIQKALATYRLNRMINTTKED